MNDLKYSQLYHYLVIAFLALWLTACEKKNEYITPPAPEVTVSQPIQQKITDYLEFTGTTQSVSYAEVKAQASGILKSIHFEPGTYVKQGELLFTIDPKPYQAKLAAAQAELISAKAQLERTQAELNRADELIKKNFISRTEHLQRKTERDVAQAAIGLKIAHVHSAEIELSYTQVVAPINGRVGRNLIDRGNLVDKGEATLLTTVTQYHPMYAYFHLNERDLLRIMKLRAKQSQQMKHDTKMSTDSKPHIPLYLGLTDEKAYPHQGELNFSASSLNTSTGTIELRGVFANTAHPARLIPGLFARLRLPIGASHSALLITERALGVDQSGQYLLVVNQENKVEKRKITIGQDINGLIEIKTGIKKEDRIVINGLQKARPGSVVNPKTITPTTTG